jgi:TP901 family phage tail tape measure protein
MSKLMKEIETMVATSDPKLEEFAKTSGMSAADFAEAWKKDPLTALDAFVTGWASSNETGGNSIVSARKAWAITEVRQSAAVLALAKSNGLLTDAMNLSNTAWEENTALTNEAATRYATTESKITLLQNSVNNMAIAVGDKLKPLLNGLMDGATDAVKWLTTVIAGEQDLRS